jgi:hypothetical protein
MGEKKVEAPASVCMQAQEYKKAHESAEDASPDSIQNIPGRCKAA